LASDISLHSLFRPIDIEINQVERRIKKWTTINDGISEEILGRYLNGGKRIRSAIILFTGKMFNADMDTFYTLAASVEMLHCATLAHDDILDGGSIRRHQQIGNSLPPPILILIGDYLLAQSTAALASIDNPVLMRVDADSLRITCEGEYQQWSRTDKTYDEKIYIDIIQKKTASLFGASAEMAAILAGVDPETRMKMRDYGVAVGTVYQIVDDILDLIGNEAALGKTLRQDIRRGTLTLPMIKYLEKHDKSIIPDTGSLDDVKLKTLIDTLLSSGAIEASIREAEKFVVSGKRALSGLPEGVFRNGLSMIADYMIDQAKNPIR
jgi:geranylgeranyl pyrophosphate synthase